MQRRIISIDINFVFNISNISNIVVFDKANCVVNTIVAKILRNLILLIRLIVGSNFDSNYWNRFNSTISILEIESKFESISTFLKLT